MKQIQNPPREISSPIRWGVLLGGIPVQVQFFFIALLFTLFFSHIKGYYGYFLLDHVTLKKTTAFTEIVDHKRSEFFPESADQYESGDQELAYHYTVESGEQFNHRTMILDKPISGEMNVHYWAAVPRFHSIDGLGIPSRVMGELIFDLLILLLPAFLLILSLLGQIGYHKQVLRLLKYGIPIAAKLIKKEKVEKIRRYMEGGYRNSFFGPRRTTTMAMSMAEDSAFPMHKLTFSYMVPSRDGTTKHTLTIQTRYPQVLEDEPEELLLYNPRNPSEALLFDHLEYAPKLNDTGELYREDPISELFVAPLFLVCSPLLGFTLLPLIGADLAPILGELAHFLNII